MRLIVDGREHVLRAGDTRREPPGVAALASSRPAVTAACGSRCAPRATEAFLQPARGDVHDRPDQPLGLSEAARGRELVRDFGATGHAAKPSLGVQRALARTILRLGSREYVFVDEWDVAAPREAVFDAIADGQQLPRVVEAGLHRRRVRRRAGGRQGARASTSRAGCRTTCTRARRSPRSTRRT